MLLSSWVLRNVTISFAFCDKCATIWWWKIFERKMVQLASVRKRTHAAIEWSCSHIEIRRKIKSTFVSRDVITRDPSKNISNGEPNFAVVLEFRKISILRLLKILNLFQCTRFFTLCTRFCDFVRQYFGTTLQSILKMQQSWVGVWERPYGPQF